MLFCDQVAVLLVGLVKYCQIAGILLAPSDGANWEVAGSHFKLDGIRSVFRLMYLPIPIPLVGIIGIIGSISYTGIQIRKILVQRAKKPTIYHQFSVSLLYCDAPATDSNSIILTESPALSHFFGTSLQERKNTIKSNAMILTTLRT